MESFAGFRQKKVISWASDCFVVVEAWIFSTLTPNLNVDSEWQGIATTTSEGYQMPLLGKREQAIWPWNVICVGMDSYEDKYKWKSCRIFLSFCSRGEILNDMGIVETFPTLITAIVRHRRFMVVQDGWLMKSFAGFLQVVILLRPGGEYSSWELAKLVWIIHGISCCYYLTKFRNQCSCSTSEADAYYYQLIGSLVTCLCL